MSSPAHFHWKYIHFEIVIVHEMSSYNKIDRIKVVFNLNRIASIQCVRYICQKLVLLSNGFYEVDRFAFI